MPDSVTHQPIHRTDYRPPAYLIDRVDLIVDLEEDHARVRARLAMRWNPNAAGAAPGAGGVAGSTPSPNPPPQGGRE
jgi:hypothetical protein